MIKILGRVGDSVKTFGVLLPTILGEETTRTTTHAWVTKCLFHFNDEADDLATLGGS